MSGSGAAAKRVAHSPVNVCTGMETMTDNHFLQIRKNLLEKKISHEWMHIATDLLLLDLVLATNDEFMELCIDLHKLDCDIRDLVKSSRSFWHAEMHGHQLDHAALACIAVFTAFTNACSFLGDNGKATLSKMVFKNKARKIPYRVRMVLNYMDWKIAVTSTSGNRKRPVHAFDGLFTPEEVCRNIDVRCAVNIGMRAIELRDGGISDHTRMEALQEVDRVLEQLELKHGDCDAM